MPATRAGRRSNPAISVMLSADVFVATTAPAGAWRSMSLHPLRRGFDDDVRSGERCSDVGRRAQPTEAGVGVRRRGFTQLHGLAQDAVNLSAGLLERWFGHVVQRRRIPRRDRGMGDAVAHRAGTKDGDALDVDHLGRHLACTVSSITSSMTAMERSMSASEL